MRAIIIIGNVEAYLLLMVNVKSYNNIIELVKHVVNRGVSFSAHPSVLISHFITEAYALGMNPMVQPIISGSLPILEEVPIKYITRIRERGDIIQVLIYEAPIVPPTLEEIGDLLAGHPEGMRFVKAESLRLRT